MAAAGAVIESPAKSSSERSRNRPTACRLPGYLAGFPRKLLRIGPKLPDGHPKIRGDTVHDFNGDIRRAHLNSHDISKADPQLLRHRKLRDIFLNAEFRHSATENLRGSSGGALLHWSYRLRHTCIVAL